MRHFGRRLRADDRGYRHGGNDRGARRRRRSQRGGPSTGIPTKTEQADLNQVFGASQGDYPRAIIAPTDTTDCFYTAVEALNLAEKYQLPVTIITDLLLSEHPETIEADALTTTCQSSAARSSAKWPRGARAHSSGYEFTKSGVSPRALPGTENTIYVAATDDHDEEGVLISDVFTSPPCAARFRRSGCGRWRRLLEELAPPALEGPADAEVTLIGWGSTQGVIHEAIGSLADEGITRESTSVQVSGSVPRQRNQRDSWQVQEDDLRRRQLHRPVRAPSARRDRLHGGRS